MSGHDLYCDERDVSIVLVSSSYRHSPRLRTMPAKGTHSRRPSGSCLGLHLEGRLLNVSRTEPAMLSGLGGFMRCLDKVRLWVSTEA